MRRRRGLRLRLEHMLHGIARIAQLTAGKTVEDYLGDEGLREMIERNIARISEAARHRRHRDPLGCIPDCGGGGPGLATLDRVTADATTAPAR